MNLNLYKEICNKLLLNHFGIELTDTSLDKEAAVFFNDGQRPYQAVQIIADDDLKRIDNHSFFPDRELTTTDEFAAIVSVTGGYFELDDQPATCGLCGSHTDFNEIDDAQQHHTCLKCGHEFVSVFRDNDD